MAYRHGLGWYLKRLSVMGPREIAHRVGEQVALRRLRLRHGRFEPPPGAERLHFFNDSQRQLPGLPWDDRELLREAEPVLDGHWPALGFSWRWQDNTDSWQKAPDSGALWPNVFFADVPYRGGNPYGDARVTWEPARLQQLVALARLTAHDGFGDRPVDLLEHQLSSWVRENPPWIGVHYISAMECGLRILAVAYAIDIARPQLKDRKRVAEAATALVANHAHLILRRLSLHSSAGNHTIAEAAGLVHAGVLFPELPEAQRWHDTGLELLTREFHRQVLDDGGGLEQAPWYLLFITDLAGLVVALLDHHGRTIPDGLRERLELARSFLAAFASEPEGLPHFGDRDDGFALSRDLRLSFSVPTRCVRTKVFAASGYSLARSGGGSEVEVIFDHGPLGMLPSCGHGHADALSIVMRHAGNDVLIDPGTFTYTGNPDWRRYFRSTAAHNTVMVDGRDQAVQEDSFLWSAPYEARLIKHEAEADSFTALAVYVDCRNKGQSFAHLRGIVLRGDGSLAVWDRVEGSGTHEVAMHWHLAGPAQASDGAIDLGNGFRMRMPEGLEVKLLCASMDPPCGWRSSIYGKIQPVTTIRGQARMKLPCELMTLIHRSGTDVPPNRCREDSERFRRWGTER